MENGFHVIRQGRAKCATESACFGFLLGVQSDL